MKLFAQNNKSRPMEDYIMNSQFLKQQPLKALAAVNASPNQMQSKHLRKQDDFALSNRQHHNALRIHLETLHPKCTLPTSHPTAEHIFFSSAWLDCLGQNALIDIWLPRV